MRRLRQKLEVDPNRPRHLLTVRGIGYRLVAVGNASAGLDQADV
jgi:DNA-binding response OmpR family regulator